MSELDIQRAVRVKEIWFRVAHQAIWYINRYGSYRALDQLPSDKKEWVDDGSSAFKLNIVPTIQFSRRRDEIISDEGIVVDYIKR